MGRGHRPRLWPRPLRQLHLGCGSPPVPEVYSLQTPLRGHWPRHPIGLSRTPGVVLQAAARCRGVHLSSFWAWMSAPASIKTVTTAGLALFAAATCRGVCPPSLRALTSAPASIRAVTKAGVVLSAAATCRGVSPPIHFPHTFISALAFTSAPASSRTVTADRSLRAVATCRGLTRCRWFSIARDGVALMVISAGTNSQTRIRGSLFAATRYRPSSENRRKSMST